MLKEKLRKLISRKRIHAINEEKLNTKGTNAKNNDLQDIEEEEWISYYI